MKGRSLLVVAIFLFSNVCPAQVIDARVTDYGWIDILPPLRTLLDDAVEDLEADLNADQPIRDPKRFLKGTANSTLLAPKGVGTDYANDTSNLLVAVGIGAAWDGEKDVALEDEMSGLAGASSLVIGSRLHHLGWSTILGQDARKFTGYMNIGQYSHSQTIPSGDIDILGDIEGVNLGLHLRHDWIEGRGDDWWGWGGVKLHLGYEYSKNTVELDTTIDREFELDTGQGVIRNQIKGNPHYEIDTVIHSFPLEISSDVRFLNIFTLYGGLGADFNTGHSIGKGEVSGDVNPLICVNGICSTLDALPELEVRANLDAKANIDAITYRYFGGLQIDLSHHMHVYGQAEKLIGTEVVGVAVGLKYSH